MDRLQMGPPPALFTQAQRHNSMPVKMDVYESDLLGFNHRFQSIREQREASEGLIQELLTYCERTQEGLRQENATLRHQLSESQLDLDDARTTRREFQQRLKVADAHVQSMSAEITNANNRNLYVLVLLDGDGLIFQDHFVQAGIEGGKKAAYALRRAIVSLCGQFADEVEIVAKVCANLTGLARAMRRDGCIEAEFDLKEFALGFTQAKAHFDFIDVGYGKERADSKIKELTRWHLRNYNCKQILLGVSHDAGYAPFLDEILQDHDSRARVTVIEGSPTVRELRDTKVNVIQFEELFRADKLINRSPDSSHNASFALGPGQQGQLQTQALATMTVPPVTNAAPAAPAAPTLPASWAAVTRSATPPPQITTPLAGKMAAAKARGASSLTKAAAAAAAAWNPGPRGLDAPIAVMPVALESIKKRKDTDKLCNNHYLRGPCVKGSDCCFEHRYKPTLDEIHAIAHLARLNPCTKGQECDIENCIYGHHCPTVVNGVCGHPHCKFRVSEHPPDTKFRNNHIEDN
ncbi:hypothetical protein VD0004_g6326 [Verticillium dahliae]|nr:hypothetical protein VD0004_g6326 [Verticillium dahliae]PNH71254.1 hypothetical protein VD0001_g6276 [Verticillium dahliae]